MMQGFLDDGAARAHVVGSWLLDPHEPCAVVPPGMFAMTFTRAGDLVYSQRWSEGIERIFLTYRIEHGQLVTDQPSDPREQRTPLALDDAGRLLAYDLGERTCFVREMPGQELDPDAALLALAARAVRDALAATAAGAPVSPFLVHEDGAGQRSSQCFYADTPEEAQAAAEAAAKTLHEARTCVYVVDGYLGGGAHGMHALVIAASRRGRPSALVVAQPYTFDAQGRGRASGGFTPPEETGYGWLP